MATIDLDLNVKNLSSRKLWELLNQSLQSTQFSPAERWEIIHELRVRKHYLPQMRALPGMETGCFSL